MLAYECSRPIATVGEQRRCMIFVVTAVTETIDRLSRKVSDDGDRPAGCIGPTVDHCARADVAARTNAIARSHISRGFRRTRHLGLKEPSTGRYGSFRNANANTASPAVMAICWRPSTE